jgi:hypothetical protein
MDFGNMWDSEMKNYAETNPEQCEMHERGTYGTESFHEGTPDDIPTNELKDSDYKCLRLINDELESGTKTVMSQINEIEELQEKIDKIRDLTEGSEFEAEIYKMFNKEEPSSPRSPDVVHWGCRC